jgi:Lon protease-like protein
MTEDQFFGDFSGLARLFPLPNLVLFPHAVQQLHIFEPRYRQLIADALGDDRLIATVLLRPGWEDLYNGNPALHKVACLGKVIAEKQLPDGRYNVLLRGTRRLRLKRERQTDRLYRVAAADVLHDNPPEELSVAKALRGQLADALLPRFHAKAAAKEQIRDLFHGELPLGALCDVLAFALPFPPEMKQGLLEQLDVPRRAEQLIRLIEGLQPDPEPVAADPNRKFPPDFSIN